MSPDLRRRLFALCCAALLGCRTTDIEKSATVEAAPSVIIEPVLLTDEGDKLYVGGLLCQLVRKEGKQRILVASESSSVEDPIRITGLKPGYYRLSIKGGGIHKITEEFELESNTRLRFEIDLELARRLKTVDQALEGITPGGRYLVVRYSAGPVIFLASMGTLFVIKSLLDGAIDEDDDDDEDEALRQELGVEPIQSVPAYYESLRNR